jgi:hypothetical protein
MIAVVKEVHRRLKVLAKVTTKELYKAPHLSGRQPGTISTTGFARKSMTESWRSRSNACSMTAAQTLRMIERGTSRDDHRRASPGEGAQPTNLHHSDALNLDV